ncbi:MULTISPECIES: response regulator [Xanthobacter]|uniref:response regulator n=1 Tax=Xanthobacter TaxID=279 RepID=UPI001F3C413F|nr:response regulator [Xanthobacter sp. NFH-6]
MNAQTPQNPSILLVDDDADNLSELHEGLEMLGIPTLTATSASEALDLVEVHPHLQVVVTDLEMPRIDGIELLQKLSARRRRAPLAAIVVTGHASLDRAVGALRLRAVDFLQKPVTADEVAGAIARALALVGGETARPRPPAPATPGGVDWAEYLRVMLAAQADRAAIFEPNLFGDPAWEMMLDLMMSEAHRREISVTSLCLASGVPTTTALRRIDELMEAGFVSKHPDPHDRRRIMVRLTPLGRERMEAFVLRQSKRLGLELD